MTLPTARLCFGRLLSLLRARVKYADGESSSSYRSLYRTRNLSSHINVHTHSGSTVHNHVTLTFDRLTPRKVNACRGLAIEHRCTEFAVDSSSRFCFGARTRTQTHKMTDATDHPTYASATVAGVGNDMGGGGE